MWSNTASATRVGDEVWVITIDGSIDRRTMALIRVRDGEVVGRSDVLDERGSSEIGGIAIRPSPEHDALDALLVVGGVLESWRVRRDGSVVSRTPSVALASNTRLATAVASDARDCVTARDRSTGVLRMGRAESDAPPLIMEPIAETAPFASVPFERDGRCATALYLPDAFDPARGSIGVSGIEARVGGWFGTAPVGLAGLSHGRSGERVGAVLAVQSPRAASTLDLHWVDVAGTGSCHVGEPLASFPYVGGSGAPLGALVAVLDGSEIRVALADITAAGELAWGRIRLP